MAEVDGDGAFSMPHVAGDAPSRLDRTAPRRVALVRRIELLERAIVAHIATPARGGALRQCTIYLNTLGNGWLYVPMALLVILSDHPQRWSVLLAAVLAVGGAHIVYPIVKRWVGRERPFVADPSLHTGVAPLDRFSFPSGHCMTFAAVLIPVGYAFPRTVVVLFLLWLLIAWARVASAHHFVSDVIAGTVLGVFVAWPISARLVL